MVNILNKFKKQMATFAFFVCGIQGVLYSQSYYFDKYDVKDGLAQSKVSCLVQDKKGYLWLGTAIGLSKYDGVHITNYSTETGLAENGVKSILIDSRGIMWLGHISGGITRLINGKFERISINKIEHDISAITEDSKGNIWISSVGEGVTRINNPGELDKAKISYTQFRSSEGLSDFVFASFKRKNGTLLFITDLGLKTFDENSKRFEYFGQGILPGYFQITCIYEDAKDNLWLGTYHGGLYKYNHESHSLKIFDGARDGLAFNWVSTISGDKMGNIWVGTWGGGMSTIKDDAVVENFSLSNGLPDNKIWAITEDREGNILIGSNEHGLLVYKGKKFTSFSKKDGLQNDQVWAVNTDKKGRLWFGTNEGISILDPKTGKFEYMNRENSNLLSNQIRFLKKDLNGNMWIGTNDNGIQVYMSDRNKLVADPLLNKYFPHSNSLVSALEIDKDNNLWMGTTEFLVYYEINNQKIAVLKQSDGLAGNDISTVFCDKNNVVWVGSKNSGLTRIKGSEIKSIEMEERFTSKFITEVKNGDIWVGTEDRGILVFKDSKITKRYKTADGLLSNNITCLSVDKEGNVFIGTSSGLNKYNAETNTFTRYSEKSGFTGIEVKDNATYTDADGNMWFGTINGAFQYAPKHDISKTLEPITFINGFRVNSVARDMIQDVTLNHRESSIAFDFGSIWITNAQGVKYRYQLVGADPDWITVDYNTNTVSYSHLPPGDYTFQIKASTDNGVWNKEPITYRFTINPPFWKSWWFYTILAVLLGGGIFLFIHFRTRSLLNDKRILEEKVKERTAEVIIEKEKSEALLLNTLPSKVVDDLKKYGKTEPEVFENVTVYFSDICNFTDISGRLDPKVTISELNELFTAFDDIMTRHNCERIKTLGDGYMAVSGIPEKDENHALNMAKAALEIRDFLQERAKTHEIKWLARIGLNSGKVTGGIVGVRKYLYDIFGDTVNTASRMESNSEPMRINCSESTYSILKDQFKFSPRDVKMVKGKGEMQMYFLEGEK